MLASVATQAFGFAPAPVAPVPVVRAAAPQMGVESELGATGPLGFWDPLGMASGRPEKFGRWRAVEIKHGRVAMMATTGYMVQECMRWPGYLSTSSEVKFADLPNGILGFAAIPPAGLLQIFLFCAAMEVATWPFYENVSKTWPPLLEGYAQPGKAPGDVAGDLWVRYSDPAVKAQKLNVELNNGRAAMLGSLGMLMHDHITGSWVPPGF